MTQVDTNNSEREPRLVIVDDHSLVAHGFKRILSESFTVVAVLQSGDELLRWLETNVVDCVLLDIEMPVLNGFSVLEILRQRGFAKVLIVSMHCDSNTVEAALRLGASGYVAKDDSIESLHTGIRAVVGGGTYVSPSLRRASHRLGLRERDRAFSRLTPRQQEILTLIADGRSLSDIGRRIGVSASTVTFHKQRAMRALGILDDSALRRYAVLASLRPDS